MPQAVLHLSSPKWHGTGKRPTFAPSTLHPTGVYRASTSRCCWCALTAPLHPYLKRPHAANDPANACLGSCGLFIGGMFLWHFPHDRSHWALPSKSGLSGARTFLRLARRTSQSATASLPLLVIRYTVSHFLGFHGNPACQGKRFRRNLQRTRVG